MAFLSLSEQILRWFLWGYRSLSFVSKFFPIIILRSLYQGHCMTNAADEMPSNIQVMNQPTSPHRTLTNAGFRRENLGRILQSRDDLLNVVAPRSKAWWRWSHSGQFVVTHHYSWSAEFDNGVVTLCYEWVALQDLFLETCTMFTFVTCCVKAETLWWTDRSLSRHTELLAD